MDVGEYMRRKEREKEQRERKEQRKAKKNNNMSASEAVEKYSSMSEEQLMQELFKVGSVSKGNISAGELDAFYENVKAFLTPEQSARMKELIILLKNQ